MSSLGWSWGLLKSEPVRRGGTDTFPLGGRGVSWLIQDGPAHRSAALCTPAAGGVCASGVPAMPCPLHLAVSASFSSCPWGDTALSLHKRSAPGHSASGRQGAQPLVLGRGLRSLRGHEQSREASGRFGRSAGHLGRRQKAEGLVFASVENFRKVVQEATRGQWWTQGTEGTVPRASAGVQEVLACAQNQEVDRVSVMASGQRLTHWRAKL